MQHAVIVELASDAPSYCVSLRILIQATVLCELLFMAMASAQLVALDCAIPLMRRVKPLVVAHVAVCACLALLTSVIYWTTPVAWPFAIVALLLTLSDIILVILKNYCRKNYGRVKTRKNTVLFKHVW